MPSSSEADRRGLPRVRLEFYGIPRERAGRDAIEVEGATLGDVLSRAGRALPRFGEACLDGPSLRPGYLASINGERFTTDVRTPLSAQDIILVLSADVGG